MKKILISTICLLAVLTGCGTADNRENTSSSPVSESSVQEQTQAPAETDSAEIIVTTVVTENVTETVTENVTTTVYVAVPNETETEAVPVTEAQNPLDDVVTSPVREPDTVKPDRESVIEGYKKIVRTRIEKVISEGNDTPLVSYALYDMDYDGTPELLVKYGSCEADFRIGIFKYQSDGIITLAEEMPGSHTSFGYDHVANQIVLVTGHMNYGHMAWYDIDENGQLRFLIDTGEFEYGTGDEDFDAIMNKYNVAWLDYSEFFGSDTTWVSVNVNGYMDTQEYGGYDFRYLENYSF